MRVALTDVGRCGKLDLVFAARGGQTILLDSYCEVPFKITRTLSSATGGIAHIMLMHCTAGVFGGDRLEMTVRVQRGARVRMTQQSATRVHPSEGRIAVQTDPRPRGKRRGTGVPARSRDSVCRVALSAENIDRPRAGSAPPLLGGADGRPHRPRRGMEVR
jgi:hypothetical protein